MKGEMVQIVNFDVNRGTKTVTPHIDSDKVTEILNERRVDKDTPFVVVSIIGTLRSGKSFLANALIRFLDYLDRNRKADFNGWMEEDVEMSGVEWKNGKKSVTRGIWMWNQPFILASDGDQEIGVLLLDCQGLYDPKFGSHAVDSLLTLLALRISKIHLVNMTGVTRSTDFDNLENCIRYYQSTQLGRTIDEIFNTLVLVHRDWTSDTRLGERESELNKGIDDSEDDDEDDDDDDDDDDDSVAEEESMNMIIRAFKRVREFMLPLPGPMIRLGSVEKKLLLSDMLSEPESREFFRWISELCLLLLVKLPQEKNEPSVLTSQDELISTMEKLRSNYGDGKVMFPLGSRDAVFERTAILSVQSEIEQLKLPEVDAKIIIRHMNNEEELLSRLLEEKQGIDNYINQRKREIRAASQVSRTPEYTASMEELWRLVESKAGHSLSALQERKIVELKSRKKKKVLDIVKVAVPTVVGLTALGIATGGIGVLAFGLPALITVAGGGVAGTAVATATATGVLVTKEKKEKQEIESEKREQKQKRK